MLDDQIKHVHCIGIGGIGVSALAELLLAQGCKVSGSDIKTNQNTERLKRLGAKIYIGHQAQNVADVEGVIYSSAITSLNPEYKEAEKRKIHLMSRGEALASFVNHYQPITIAGTHGKTTTTGLVSHILCHAGLDPSYVVGGILKDQSSPVRLGKGKYCVVEVDESDASFLFMQPVFSVVTNVDADHLETYGGDFSALQRCFLDYLATIPAHGMAVLCVDDPVVRHMIAKIKCHIKTYGFSEQADVRAYYFRQSGMMSLFNVHLAKKDISFPVTLSLPGQHNVENALAAIGIALELGVSVELIQAALATFPGVDRRFQGHGQMSVASGKAMVIEDYGHHPREIKATLDAAKMAWPQRRIVLVFQPHRYSRTRDLYREFIDVLKNADKLYLLDVYSAGEDPLEKFFQRCTGE